MTFDIPFFTLLQQQMFNHLKETYPELEMGTYTHIANSLHLYENNFVDANRMLKYDTESDMMPLLEQNLIDVAGNVTHGIESICDDEEYIGSDKLLKWIEENAK